MIPFLIRLLTGVQARWSGIEPMLADGTVPQRIYFANHRSNLDAPVIWASLPNELRRTVRPVAAQDYWEAGRIRPLLAKRVFKCVLIERKRVTHHHSPLEPMEAALREGASLIIFPEGSRADGDAEDLSEFKSGLWHLAKHFPQIQLVPVFLENLNRILPKGDFLLVPLLAAVRFGPPISFDAEEEKSLFLTRAGEAIRALKQEPKA